MSRLHSHFLTQQGFLATYSKKYEANKRPPGSPNSKSVCLQPLQSNISIKSVAMQSVSEDSEFFRYTPDSLLLHVEDVMDALPFG